MLETPEKVLIFNRGPGAAIAAEPVISLGNIQIFFEICHLAYAIGQRMIPEHQHPHFQLAIPLSGPMKVSCDAVTCQLDPDGGGIAIVPPFTLHRFIFPGDEITYFISISLGIKVLKEEASDAAELIAEQLQKENFFCPLTPHQKIMLEDLKSESVRDGDEWSCRLLGMKIKLLIGEIFGRYLSCCREKLGGEHKSLKNIDRVELIRHRIANRLNSARSPLPYAASCCGLSTRQVNRIFKAATGKTVNAYWLERKLELTVHLLNSTDMPIADVAHTLGFHKQSLFTDFCVRHLGNAPTEFRKINKMSGNTK